MVYPYRALDRSTREIRIVNILPSQADDAQDDVVCCSMEQVSLADHPIYNALSYVWGGESVKSAINVDGHEVQVTTNLESALKHLRQRERTVTFWIDALAINQSDNEEKSWQVEQMLSIYRAASSVLIWLGPSAEDSDLAMDKIMTLGEKIQLSGKLPEFDTYKYVMSFNNEQMAMICTAAFRGVFEIVFEEVEQATKWTIPAVNDLLHRAWWTRVWVLQELAGAKQVSFVCGQKTVPERYMYLGLGVLFAYRSNLLTGKIRGDVSDFQLTFARRQWSSWVEDSRPIAQLRCRELCRDSDTRSHMFTLKQLLHLICLSSSGDAMGAKDSRDRVYALLGLASDRLTLNLHVNYSLPANVIYCAATRAMLHNGSLSLHEALALNKFPKKQSNLPTWVPDWSGTISAPFQGELPKWKKSLSSFTPESKSFEQLKEAILRSDDPRCLFIPTIIVDSIGNVAQSWEICKDEDDYLDESKMISWLKETHTLVSKLHRTACGKDSIWRTLILDTDQDSDGRFLHPSADLENAYLMLRKGQVRQRSRKKRAAPAYVELLARANTKRRFCVTETGYLVMAPEGAEKGDLVGIVPNADVPFVFREYEAMAGTTTYEVVGEAYVHGLMHGELFEQTEELQDGDLQDSKSAWDDLKMLAVY